MATNTKHSPMLTVLSGHCLEVLRSLTSESVQCCVTSPPYWGLRDYGCEGQIGLEKTPEEFVAAIVEVFREVRRVLRKDGTCWVNLGDSYHTGSAGVSRQGSTGQRYGRRHTQPNLKSGLRPEGLKPKDLVGIPWRVAFALQADGWYLRQDIIWHKPNPMPESVSDRCTKSHEYLFLLSKSERYFYDADAIKEPVSGTANPRGNGVNPKAKHPAGWASGTGRRHDELAGRYPQPKHKQNESFSTAINGLVEERNKRSVWTVGTYAYPEAHFATYPPDLIKPCILAGTKPGDVVLDPFGGSGTTGQVSLELGRKAVLIELNPEYVSLIEQRCNITPGLALA